MSTLTNEVVITSADLKKIEQGIGHDCTVGILVNSNIFTFLVWAERPGTYWKFFHQQSITYAENTEDVVEFIIESVREVFDEEIGSNSVAEDPGLSPSGLKPDGRIGQVKRIGKPTTKGDRNMKRISNEVVLTSADLETIEKGIGYGCTAGIAVNVEEFTVRVWAPHPENDTINLVGEISVQAAGSADAVTKHVINSLKKDFDDNLG